MKIKIQLFLGTFFLFTQLATAQFVSLDSLAGKNGLFSTGGFLGSVDSSLYYLVLTPNDKKAVKVITNGKNPRVILDSLELNENISQFLGHNNTAYFIVENTSSFYTELYKTDGTKNGTELISNNERISNLNVFKDNIIFNERVKNSSEKSFSSYSITNKTVTSLTKLSLYGIIDMVVKDTTIYMIAHLESDGTLSLCSSNGKINDLVKIKTLSSTYDNSRPFMSVSGNLIFFFFNSANLHSRYLWVSDGTTANTKELVASKREDFYDARVTTTYNGLFYTRIIKNDLSYVLYSSDGTLSGTKQVETIPNFSTDYDPTSFFTYKNKLFFVAQPGFSGRYLMVIDGNKPINLAAPIDNVPVYQRSFAIYKDSLLLVGEKSSSIGDLLLFGGTGAYKNISNINNLPPNTFSLSRFFKVGDKIYCIGEKDKRGFELWEYDPNTKFAPSPLTSTISQTGSIKCNGDKTVDLKVTVSGGLSPFSYLWSNQKTTESINGLGAGEYIVTVIDNAKQSSISKVTITEPTKLTLTTSSKAGNPQFKNGNAAVTATGGTTPYSYLWNTMPPQTTATAVNLSPNNYIVTVTDANNCKSIANVTVALSTSSNELWEKYRFEVFPNPTSDWLNIKCNNSTLENIVLNLFDQTGRLVKTQQMTGAEHQIMVSDLPKGVYTLQCAIGAESANTSVIIK